MAARLCRLAACPLSFAKVYLSFQRVHPSFQAAAWCVPPQQLLWMPKLRSASVQAQPQAGAEASAAAEVTLQWLHEKGSRPDAKRAAGKPGRKRAKAAASTKVSSETTSSAASHDTALQQVPKKKAKVRKALLTTLWTAEELVPLKAKVEQLYSQLNELYKDPPCPLNYDSPFQLLVAVILSAQVPSADDCLVVRHMVTGGLNMCTGSQSTDKKVNEITPALFQMAPDASAVAALEVLK